MTMFTNTRTPADCTCDTDEEHCRAEEHTAEHDETASEPKTPEVSVGRIREVFWPLTDDGEEDRRHALCYYLEVVVRVDGTPYYVGVMVGARESDHENIRAAGGGVRPFCGAWWTDWSDHEDLPPELVEPVSEALVAASYKLFCAADDTAEGYR